MNKHVWSLQSNKILAQVKKTINLLKKNLQISLIFRSFVIVPIVLFVDYYFQQSFSKRFKHNPTELTVLAIFNTLHFQNIRFIILHQKQLLSIFVMGIKNGSFSDQSGKSLPTRCQITTSAKLTNFIQRSILLLESQSCNNIIQYSNVVYLMR